MLKRFLLFFYFILANNIVFAEEIISYKIVHQNDKLLFKVTIPTTVGDIKDLCIPGKIWGTDYGEQFKKFKNFFR